LLIHKNKFGASKENSKIKSRIIEKGSGLRAPTFTKATVGKAGRREEIPVT
jgi:hypothetical protein